MGQAFWEFGRVIQKYREVSEREIIWICEQRIVKGDRLHGKDYSGVRVP